MAYLVENRLDASHPDAPYLADNSVPEFGALPAATASCFNTACSNRRTSITRGATRDHRCVRRPQRRARARCVDRQQLHANPDARGYVVFQLDNRGSAFRGSAFQAPIHGRLGEVEVEDQVTGAKWLASQSFVDATRLGVWGWSYGGYLTLMMMFKAPDIFRAGVSGAPVTDWSLYDTHYTERYLGRPRTTARATTRARSYPMHRGCAASFW